MAIQNMEIPSSSNKHARFVRGSWARVAEAIAFIPSTRGDYYNVSFTDSNRNW